MKKIILFLMLISFPFIGMAATDSVQIVQQTLALLQRRPIGLSESQGATLLLAPGKVDTLAHVDTITIHAFVPLPFFGSPVRKKILQPVYFDGRKWIVKNAVIVSVSEYPSFLSWSGICLIIFVVSIVWRWVELKEMNRKKLMSYKISFFSRFELLFYLVLIAEIMAFIHHDDDTFSFVISFSCVVWAILVSAVLFTSSYFIIKASILYFQLKIQRVKSVHM